jgi:hypothetical protein
MATYTSIINKVLVKLRESEVAAPTSSTYSAMIGELVNETKREVEDAHKWTALRQTITIATVASTATYAITGAGQRWKAQQDTNFVYDTTSSSWITKSPTAYVKEQARVNTDQGRPTNFYIEGVDSNGDSQVTFWRTPDGVYSIDFDLIVPQGDFETGNEVLSVPYWPVVLGTYAKAIAERGEDDGRAHGEALNKYGFALSDAIAIDAAMVDQEDMWTTR